MWRLMLSRCPAFAGAVAVFADRPGGSHVSRGLYKVFSAARITLYIIYKLGIKRFTYQTIKDRYFTILHKVYAMKAKNQEFTRIYEPESLIIQGVADYIHFIQLRYAG